MRRAIFVVSALLLAAAPSWAQHEHAASSQAADRVGTVNLKNEGNRAAQAPFQRGLALLHNFEYAAAAESFRAAQAADPGFVLAYWGEAMTHNHPLWAEQDEQAARAALSKLGPTPEARRAKVRSAREGQWLAAVEALYGSGTKIERDFAYADRMKAVFEADPSDIDARAFRALSIMGLAHSGRDIPLYMQAASLLEDAFPQHPDHPGVVHYLIHTYDDPAHAPLGERAAQRYAKIAPDAGHAQHMVSHIYLALGRWPEVEAANVNAMRVVNEERAKRGMPSGACGHYVEWQVYSVLQQGKDAKPLIEACRTRAQAELAASTDRSAVGTLRSQVTSWSDMAVRQMVETGQMPAALDLPADRYAVPRFNLAYVRLLDARRDAPRAAAALADMRRDREAIAAVLAKEMPDDDQYLPWLDRAIAQGEAIVALAQGKRDEGIRLLRNAAAAEAELPVPFGPPVLAKPSAELLGEEMLAAGRKADAVDAFERALAAAPNRRLSVQGLAAASGKPALARSDGTH